ncbi:hypothetical protein NKG05_26465 [Oerskovia sp. M15]
MTDQTARITSLWNGSWLAALIVGVITWGLILWCVAVYRKRKDDHVLPVQTRYHLPSRSCTRQCRSSWCSCSSTSRTVT